MSWIPIDWTLRVGPPDANVPLGLRVVSMALRLAFIAVLLAVTVHVSMPQNETIWTVYDTPGDLIRLALGLAVCLWIASQLFATPEDAHSHRTWLYLGLAAVPFVLICMVAIW